MKKSLKKVFALAIVIQMVVSMFVPAIAEEAAAVVPAEQVTPIVIDFKDDVMGTGEGKQIPDAILNGNLTKSWNEELGAMQFIVGEGGSDNVTSTALTPTNVQLCVPESVTKANYKAGVIIYEFDPSNGFWVRFRQGGAEGFFGIGDYAGKDAGSFDDSAEDFKYLTFRSPGVDTTTGFTQNRIDIFMVGGDLVPEGTTLSIKAIAFFGSEQEALAFNLETYRAEKREASISVDKATAVIGTDEVVATVTASSVFASSEVIVRYDATKLEYKADSVTGLGTNGQVVNDAANGILRIVDSGAVKAEAKYDITFTPVGMGDVDIRLTNAAFSSSASAVSNDLTVATITTNKATVTVQGDLTVTLPDGDWFSGNSTAENGKDYVFEATKWDNYDYGTLTYKIGEEGSPVEIEPDENGKYTVPAAAVTDDITIAIVDEITAKKYDVTIDNPYDEPVVNDGDKATYGEDYHFTLPADKAKHETEPGYTYNTPVITIGGQNYTTFEVEDRTYTIKGADINGDIEITISREVVAPDQLTVTVDGNGQGDAAAPTPVNRGETATLTLTKDPLYTYVVTATMGGNDATASIVENEGVYTIANVQGNVVFTVTKSVTATGGSDNYKVTNMWLVTIGAENVPGRSYTYNGQKMYWSDKYNAYCILVVSTEAPDTSAAMFGTTNTAATSIDYSGDVNGTGKIDANDAQLVYDMYNNVYTDGFTTVSMEKFLRADLNGDNAELVGLDTGDATAIVNTILGK